MKLNIVIVEDDKMVAHIHHHYLNELGSFNIVKTISDGKEAYEFLKENGHLIDIVILDVDIPSISGLDVLKKLREGGCDVSVIPITAINDNKTVSEFLNLGVVDYLVKPFTQERFNQAVLRCELKFKMFYEKSELTQHEIDQMFRYGNQANELPKGLQESTLAFVQSCLQKHRGEMLDAEQISSITNLSKVSVRKYLDYLTDNGTIQKKIDYGMVGRPKYRYLIK
jgi:response regulator of citrate/malate metabolism